MLKNLMVVALVSAFSANAFAYSVPPENLCQRAAIRKALAKLEHDNPNVDFGEGTTSITAIDQSENNIVILLANNELGAANVNVGIKSYLQGGYCEFTGDVTVSTSPRN